MEALLKNLQNPALYEHPVQRFQVIETHISWVLLTGEYAYKIKKPVNFGFLDFSTLEKRRFYCNEELRLNKRLARDYYLNVVALTGSFEAPELNGVGTVFEYAVKMKQFPQQAQFDRLLKNGKLTHEHIDLLARKVAEFHAQINIADEYNLQGTPEKIHGPVNENFTQINALLEHVKDQSDLEELQSWSEEKFKRLKPEFIARKNEGYIRECHGDMHLRNIALVDSGILIFDCIEFNDDFRWTDVLSEVAFVVMDLDDRNKSDFAMCFLNKYLEYTGDYFGLRILRYYLVYRAMVRAKVDCIRAHQAGIDAKEKQTTLIEYRSYITLAKHYTEKNPPYLIITHGLSGSGKTWFTQALLEITNAIRIRSDIERKRLFGLTDLDSSHSATDHGIYTADASHRTYAHLLKLAQSILQYEWPVIVDATFISKAERSLFNDLARRLELPFIILSFIADKQTLCERIVKREASNQDASEASIMVLENQIKKLEPITKAEENNTIIIDSANRVTIQQINSEIKRFISLFITKH